MADFTIPLYVSDGHSPQSNVVDLVFKPHEFGDHHHVTILVPPQLNGRLVLPLNMFSLEVRKAMQSAWGLPDG